MGLVTVCVAAGIRLRFIGGALLLGDRLKLRGEGARSIPKLLSGREFQALLNPNAQGNGYQPLRAQDGVSALAASRRRLSKGRAERSALSFPNSKTIPFTVVGEEGGLLGCTVVLVLYGIFFYRVWLRMVQADAYGRRYI